MKLVIKYLGFFFAIVITTVACKTNPSLQKYYVDSKENSEFISIDLPASILQLKDVDISEDIKNTLKTIKKINFLALQLNDANKELYASEKLKVKTILKNSKYKELMHFKHKTASVNIIFLGEEDAIDEVVIFGSDNGKGFALIRVLGENMNPADILKLSQKIKFDGDSNELSQLGNLLGSIK